ncbi:MAG: GNAT family N-acetyltransferase [Litoreibacter sp.]|nr:GNAT family N-acetyltransferase [Litoreibacter sp.]
MSETSALEIRLAREEKDLRGAERLRYKVFVEELGGDGALVDHAGRFERDAFDAHMDQLILVDPGRDADQFDHVIGVYRLLRGDAVDRAGRYYSETEYDLSPLKCSNRNLLELGRSCVLPDYRGGTAMFHLWQGLADYVDEHKIEILFGVASFHGTDPARIAHALSNLHHAHLAQPELRPRSKVFEPMDLIPPDAVDRPRAMKDTPALIKAYLRLGGVIGEGAFIDHDFNTIDVCLVMDTARMSTKHRDLYTKARR